VWINGPFKAGLSDMHVFRMENGLKSMIPEGKKLIADNGYKGEDVLCTPNRLDWDGIREFKKRARARHETVNCRVKSFRIVAEQWRHSTDKHQIAFEAVCVIVQYEMESGKPLFKI
jgi:DDE superfamily endonuclease